VDATPPGGTIIIGVRRWAYEPGQSLSKRASDPSFTVFPRVAERRPARIEFAADNQAHCCLAAVGTRWRPRTARKC
jgi:hypothetical protein